MKNFTSNEKFVLFIILVPFYQTPKSKTLTNSPGFYLYYIYI